MFSVSVESYVKSYRTYSAFRAFFVRGDTLHRIAHIEAAPGSVSRYNAETLRPVGGHVVPQRVELAGCELIILKEGGEV